MHWPSYLESVDALHLISIFLSKEISRIPRRLHSTWRLLCSIALQALEWLYLISLLSLVRSRRAKEHQNGVGTLLSSNYLTKSATRSLVIIRRLIDVSLCQRSEEHTSELQSLRHLVCRLL